MSTPFANEQLSAYLDGELTDAEAAELESQLEADPTLRDELASLERAIGSLRKYAPANAPDGFARAVMGKLEHEPIPANTTAFWRRPFGVPLEGLAIAAVALMVFGVALNLNVAPDTGKSAAVAQLDATPQDVPGKLDGPPMAPMSNGGASAAPEASAPPKSPARTKPKARPASDEEALGGATRAPSAPKSLAQELIGDVADTTLPGMGSGTEQAAQSAGEGTSTGTDARVAGYRYVLTTDDPEVAAALNRLASRYQGRLEDTSGRSVSGDLMTDADTASLRVHLPAAALRQFGDDLRSLGSVQQYSDNRWYTGDQVQVQIEVQMARPVQYAPSSSAPKLRKSK